MNHVLIRRSVLVGIASGLACLASLAHAQGSSTVQEVKADASASQGAKVSAAPLIAVTDLSYEEKIARRFLRYDASGSASGAQNASGGAGGYAQSSQMQSQASVHLETGEEIYINRGELRKFTSDIKGQLIKTRKLKVIQGKPWTKKDTDTLYDIIGRIKDGYYDGADYVLFGSISSVDANTNAARIANTDTTNYTLSYQMLVEFSLINVRTKEVAAGFSVTAEGRDARLTSANGGTFTLSRTKALGEMTKNLAESVRDEIVSQLNLQVDNDNN